MIALAGTSRFIYRQVAPGGQQMQHCKRVNATAAFLSCIPYLQDQASLTYK